MGDLELVIFDCDGVLVDSEPISCGVLARALTAQGLTTTLEQARSEYQGLMLDEVLAQAELRLGRALPANWIADYERHRDEAFRLELQPIAGAAGAVNRIATAGVRVCVASQGKLEKTRLSLGITGLRHLFAPDALFSAYSVAQGKPQPDLFLHAAASMEAKPARCVVVEDTPSGVTAGVAAGMRVLGYVADSDELELRRAGAEVLPALEELPGLLGLA